MGDAIPPRYLTTVAQLRDAIEKHPRTPASHRGRRDDLYRFLSGRMAAWKAERYTRPWQQLRKRVREAEHSHPDLKGRVRVSGTFYPGGEGSLADNIVLAFFFTDVMASGLVSFGQHFELHWYSDQPPALGPIGTRLSYQT